MFAVSAVRTLIFDVRTVSDEMVTFTDDRPFISALFRFASSAERFVIFEF